MTPVEKAKALVHRFEMESMALHKIQREWLVREIAELLEPSREVLFHTACKAYLAAHEETNDFPESMRAVIHALYPDSGTIKHDV